MQLTDVFNMLVLKFLKKVETFHTLLSMSCASHKIDVYYVENTGPISALKPRSGLWGCIHIAQKSCFANSQGNLHHLFMNNCVLLY